MLVFGSRARAEARRRPLKGSSGLAYFKSEWMESGDDPELSPTIFMVEQPANSTLDPHFHRQNQFQLFVDGNGTIGKSPLETVTIHYAGAYTGYGPLIAGAEGIKYFTIRPVCESGANFIKDSRDKMIRGPKRHETSQPIKPLASQALRALTCIQTIDAIAVAEDGLGARVLRLPPGSVAATPFPDAARGTFVVVLAGSLAHEGGELAQWESVFVSTQDELPRLVAGESGAEVVFLFTPAKAEAYLTPQSNQSQGTT